MIILLTKIISKIQESSMYFFFFCSYIFTKNFYIFKTFDSDFSYVAAWFTDQHSKPLGMEDEININLDGFNLEMDYL